MLGGSLSSCYVFICNVIVNVCVHALVRILSIRLDLNTYISRDLGVISIHGKRYVNAYHFRTISVFEGNQSCQLGATCITDRATTNTCPLLRLNVFIRKNVKSR